MTMAKVIDVSVHNTVSTWGKVKAAGIEGVIIRAGYGKTASQKDKSFEKHYKNAVNAGLHVGAYWYSYAVTVDEAKLEAAAFLECIKGKTFDLPVYFDIEEKTQVALGKSLCTGIVTAFCKVMEDAGYFCGVYSFDSFFASNLDTSIQKAYSCWVARVDGKNPASCTSYGMWQYSWKLSIDGFTGSVDVSNCYKDFPTIIKNAGLNGYTSTSGTAKNTKYTVTARLAGVDKTTADDVAESCQKLGMTVVTAEEG
jgi:GH25 family lysozyme M1 (1,4-beta-N-acetylmuramidase)